MVKRRITKPSQIPMTRTFGGLTYRYISSHETRKSANISAGHGLLFAYYDRYRIVKYPGLDHPWCVYMAKGKGTLGQRKRSRRRSLGASRSRRY